MIRPDFRNTIIDDADHTNDDDIDHHEVNDQEKEEKGKRQNYSTRLSNYAKK